MSTLRLPCLRYGKNASGLYEVLSCAKEMHPYTSRIQSVGFQWNAAGENLYQPVWYLHVLSGGSFGLLMRFSDAGREGDLRNRPHTLLKEVALCSREEHLSLVSVLAMGQIPENRCSGEEWLFEMPESAPRVQEYWRTGPLLGKLPDCCTLSINEQQPAPTPAPRPHERLIPPSPSKPSRKGKVFFCLSVAGNILLSSVLVASFIQFENAKRALFNENVNMRSIEAKMTKINDDLSEQNVKLKANVEKLEEINKGLIRDKDMMAARLRKHDQLQKEMESKLGGVRKKLNVLCEKIPSEHNQNTGLERLKNLLGDDSEKLLEIQQEINQIVDEVDNILQMSDKMKTLKI